MNLKEAIEIIDQYNQWRRDDSYPEPNKHEMPDPKKIGLALDILLDAVKKECSCKLPIVRSNRIAFEYCALCGKDINPEE